jgi:TonB family protein
MNASILAAAALCVALGGCGGRPPSESAPSALPVDVLADTGRGERLHVAPPDTHWIAPRAAVWLAQVAPARPAPIDAPLPEPAPAAVELPLPSPPPLEVDPGLKPPIPRGRSTLRVPPHARAGSVELDVRVTEDGTVSDAMWAGGSADTALVAAAVACALEMRFYPALQAGQPVAVWCRQRFDFGKR